MNLDYELKVYPRSKQRLAPPELAQIWPTGVSPIVQIFKKDGDTTVVAESGHIVAYIVENYDSQGLLTFNDKNQKDWVNYYLHFSEGSLQPHLVGILVGEIVSQGVPWPLRIPFQLLFSKINGLFYSKRLATNYKFLDSELEKKGGGYFVGSHISGADIMLDFPISFGLFGKLAQADSIVPGKDLKVEFPNLYKWHQMIMKEPLRLEAKKVTKGN